jgi:aerobic carbon-monoxide dehydrogenase medium subunit
MTPAPFAYDRPATLDEALSLLGQHAGEARVLAGGHSLLPLMKLRLARPDRLIDIGRLAELRGVHDRPDGGLAIGALTTWADLLADDRVRAYGALADVLPRIGDVQVRNRGTIGGSLVHADPASDIAAPALALSVVVVARSSRAERTIAAEDFFQGAFVTALEPDELVTEVRLPPAPAGVRSAYRSIEQPASGYPLAGVAVAMGPGTCTVGVTGVGELPYRAASVEAAVLGGTGFAEAAALVTDGQSVASDIHADRDYRAHVAAVMTRRALEAAAGRD